MKSEAIVSISTMPEDEVADGLALSPREIAAKLLLLDTEDLEDVLQAVREGIERRI